MLSTESRFRSGTEVTMRRRDGLRIKRSSYTHSKVLRVVTELSVTAPSGARYRDVECGDEELVVARGDFEVVVSRRYALRGLITYCRRMGESMYKQ